MPKEREGLAKKVGEIRTLACATRRVQKSLAESGGHSQGKILFGESVQRVSHLIHMQTSRFDFWHTIISQELPDVIPERRSVSKTYALPGTDKKQIITKSPMRAGAGKIAQGLKWSFVD